MHVRLAAPADVGEAAARIYDQVQASGAWLPTLSFVALGPDGKLTGRMAGTRGSLGPVPALAPAPPPCTSATVVRVPPRRRARHRPAQPDWEPYFLVRPLTRYTPAMRGTFQLPRPFTSG